MENFDTPGSRTEAVLQNMLGADNPLESPKSRVEEILQACLNDEPITVSPQSRVEELLIDVVRERGGVDVSVQELDVNQNGSYTAPMGTAYSPVVVDVEPLLITKEVTSNGTYAASDDNVDGYSAVTVSVSGGGSTPVPKKDVNFVDYDGTILYSYTAQEALALTELPENPSHTGLTAQGWNWSLADIKTQVTALGTCYIGQMYTTDDGKTRIYICIDPASPANRRKFFVCFKTLNAGNNDVTIDWGDGTTENIGYTSLHTYEHTYATCGDYIITLKANKGTIYFQGSSSTAIYGSINNCHNRARIKKIEIGDDVTIIGTYIFFYCYSLMTITIPKTVTSIENRAFHYCTSLESVVVPNSISTIPSHTFNSCYTIKSIILPKNITKIDSNAFQYCYGLTSMTIPADVTTIGASVFSADYSISEYHLLSTVPPSLGSNVFNNISSDCVIYVPRSENQTVLNAYKAATNWSNYASYMQEEPA